MMIEPPIDELEKKSKNNKYVLSVVAAKRAKEIETTRRAELATADKKAIRIPLIVYFNLKMRSGVGVRTGSGIGVKRLALIRRPRSKPHPRHQPDDHRQREQNAQQLPSCFLSFRIHQNSSLYEA